MSLDYQGHHQPPDHETGDPLHNVTDKIYPDDVYGYDAARLYGSGMPRFDQKSISIIQSARGKPNSKVRVYRAVPKIKSTSELIQDYEKQKRYILKTGNMPLKFQKDFKPAGGMKVKSAYYEWLSNEILKLKNTPEIPSEKLRINVGDWVTINRDYAKYHGDSWLKGDYQIISKVVNARDIYTEGDSIHEWGYYP